MNAVLTVALAGAVLSQVDQTLDIPRVDDADPDLKVGQVDGALAWPTPAATAVALRTLSMRCYGYSLPGRTAMGTSVRWGVVAVDPAVIPLGTRLLIDGFPDTVFVAEDTGGGIHGATLDIYFGSVTEAIRFGVQTRTVTVLR